MIAPGGGNNGGGRRPGDDNPTDPEIDELMKKGQERLRVLMGGGGGDGGGTGGGGGGGLFNRGTIGLAGLGVVVGSGRFRAFTPCVRKNSRSSCSSASILATGNPGLNFAPWPVVTAKSSTSPPSGPRISAAARDRGRRWADADHGRQHRGHRLSGRLEHQRSGETAVQPARPAGDRAGGVRSGDARDHRGDEPRADPQPGPWSDRGYGAREHPSRPWTNTKAASTSSV